mmetsp:Transcript_56482/g.83971  ORF Transcript_56482/g.83971 Transcript_56482/m.83971 type:complete len:346 (-) Transcript_56482:429-1466(-)
MVIPTARKTPTSRRLRDRFGSSNHPLRVPVMVGFILTAFIPFLALSRQTKYDTTTLAAQSFKMYHFASATTGDKKQKGQMQGEASIMPSLQEAKSFDAIFVLGGGVPSSLTNPPEFTKLRCDAAVAVAEIAAGAEEGTAKQEEKDENAMPNIVCLSAGTAHCPQLMGKNGLPIWEATSSAAYILETYGSLIPQQKVMIETTSYDTISNAYFARTTHADVAGWRNILVVTSEFHMDRSKAIFDWVFSAPPVAMSPYRLSYMTTENIGLSEEAIESRKQHERKGAVNVKQNLSKHYTTLYDIWQFLTQNHDFYSASKLVDKAKKAEDDAEQNRDETSSVLKQSYRAK